MTIERVVNYICDRNRGKATEDERNEFIRELKLAAELKAIDILEETIETLIADETDEAEELAHELAEVFNMDFRVCDMCGAIMFDGYVRDGGWVYYCSEKCLAEDFDEDGWYKECESNEESYWTQWY